MVSVIIPNHNYSQWLPKVVKSTLEQDYLKEIIIVDDHSTDNSWQIITELQKKYPDKIKAFRSPRRGGNNARNFGFKQATGDFYPPNGCR